MKKLLITTVALFLGITIYAENNIAENPSAITTTSIETALPPAEEEDIVEEDFTEVRRFSSITEIGSAFVYDKAYFNIYQAFGMRVNPYFFIGQGLGLQVSNNSLLQLQATLDARAYILDKKVTPMLTMQIGMNKVSYAPVFENKATLKDMQFVMNAGAGILIKAKEKASFTINGGYSIFTDFDNNLQGGFVRIGYVF